MKILITDDHQMFANGLAAILRELDETFEIQVANAGQEAIQIIEKEAIDILTTDISMPDINGIELIKTLKKKGFNGKIIVISMHTEIAIVKAILKENPDAYLLKNTDNDELWFALKSVLKNKQYFCEEVKNLLLNDARGLQKSTAAIVPKLSRRELEVLQLMVQEKTTGEIARSLFLSEHTIETYRKNLLRKLDAKNSVGLVAKAYQLGIL